MKTTGPGCSCCVVASGCRVACANCPDDLVGAPATLSFNGTAAGWNGTSASWSATRNVSVTGYAGFDCTTASTITLPVVLTLTCPTTAGGQFRLSQRWRFCGGGVTNKYSTNLGTNTTETVDGPANCVATGTYAFSANAPIPSVTVAAGTGAAASILFNVNDFGIAIQGATVAIEGGGTCTTNASGNCSLAVPGPIEVPYDVTFTVPGSSCGVGRRVAVTPHACAATYAYAVSSSLKCPCCPEDPPDSLLATGSETDVNGQHFFSGMGWSTGDNGWFGGSPFGRYYGPRPGEIDGQIKWTKEDGGRCTDTTTSTCTECDLGGTDAQTWLYCPTGSDDTRWRLHLKWGSCENNPDTTSISGLWVYTWELDMFADGPAPGADCNPLALSFTVPSGVYAGQGITVTPTS